MSSNNKVNQSNQRPTVSKSAGLIWDELKKVTWPSWKELQSSSIVVAIASMIIALIIYLMDSVFSNVLDVFYNFFS